MNALAGICGLFAYSFCCTLYFIFLRHRSVAVGAYLIKLEKSVTFLKTFCTSMLLFGMIFQQIGDLTFVLELLKGNRQNTNSFYLILVP